MNTNFMLSNKAGGGGQLSGHSSLPLAPVDVNGM